jgi:hypothetical protein
VVRVADARLYWVLKNLVTTPRGLFRFLGVGLETWGLMVSWGDGLRNGGRFTDVAGGARLSEGWGRGLGRELVFFAEGGY